jgi:hypothetical protein
MPLNRIYRKLGLKTKTDRKLLNLIRKVFPNPCSLLEAGSNTGHLSYILSGLNYEVTLLDRLSEPIEKARKKFQLNYVKANFICDDISNVNGNWDGVWNTGVVQCYPSLERVRIVEKLCKLGNAILIIYPDIDNLNIANTFGVEIPPGINGCPEFYVDDIASIVANNFSEVHQGFLSKDQLGTDRGMHYVWGR